MNRTLRLKRERLEAFAREQGWTTRKGDVNGSRIAEAFAMDRATIWRVFVGESPVTARFVARSIGATGLSFEELFEVVDADELVAS